MLVVVILAALQGPGAPGPAPTRRYHLEVTTSDEIDQSVIGKPKLSDGLVTSAYISVSISDTAGGKIVRVLVDSMSLQPSGALVEQLQQSRPTAAADALGASVRAMLVNGRIAGAPQISDSNPALGPIVQAIGVLFPGIRAGAKVGDQWADTNHINNNSGSRHQTGQVVASWKVTGTEGGALVLAGNSTTHTTTDNGNGQILEVQGTSIETVVIPPSGGPVVRARIDTDNTLSWSAPQLSSAIPGKNAGSLTLTPLP
ncbi:MAG: hypothetical protein ACREL5_08615 [Gemmatimonadales bacterium]